ncbi:hypothetical protein Leryth_017674 [Lithospermum erythrorhizon]|nr:hypothetical protein Leryth_017674 [Lithospermum erythrorhizon]
MQTLLFPVGVALPLHLAAAKSSSTYSHRQLPPPPLLSSKFITLNPLKPLQFSSSFHVNSSRNETRIHASANADSEKAKLAQVSKRLENTSRYFKRLGGLGFWGQLVCTVVSAVILSFSIVITGKITSPATFYATSAGIAAGFVSVFWSFGYIRLAAKLQKTINDPSKAPPRADVVKSLKNGVVLNLLGMGAAILGMFATVGLLVAKALTTSANPYYQGVAAGSSPVLALDVFLVQASATLSLSPPLFIFYIC